MNQMYLQVEILWPAMVAGLLVLATHVPLGREVLKRGIIFLDLAIAQTAAFGVVLANTFWFDGHEHIYIPSTLVAIIAAIIGSLALYAIRGLEVRIQESYIGILFVLMATGIILLLSADPHGGERLKEVLVGQILWLQMKDLLSLFIMSIVMFCVWFYWENTLEQWLFYPLFGVTITLSTQIVGVYLVFASLIIPSLCTLRKQHAVIQAYVLGALGYGVGLSISGLFDWPAGATIVWSLALVACIYALITTARSMWAD